MCGDEDGRLVDFIGGPLDTNPAEIGPVHSIMVYMAGAGRTTAPGYYVATPSGGKYNDQFIWVPDVE